MWTTNVIKEILVNSNFNVLPNLQLKTDNEYLELYKNQAFIDKNNLKGLSNITQAFFYKFQIIFYVS